MQLLEKGFIYKDSMLQFFDSEAGRFLPDRYVEGTCPRCDYDGARGDQCDNCGSTLDATDLISPRSRFTGSRPELRETEHFFFRFAAARAGTAQFRETYQRIDKLGQRPPGRHPRPRRRHAESGMRFGRPIPGDCALKPRRRICRLDGHEPRPRRRTATLPFVLYTPAGCDWFHFQLWEPGAAKRCR